MNREKAKVMPKSKRMKDFYGYIIKTPSGNKPLIGSGGQLVIGINKDCILSRYSFWDKYIIKVRITEVKARGK